MKLEQQLVEFICNGVSAKVVNLFDVTELYPVESEREYVIDVDEFQDSEDMTTHDVNV